MGQKRSTGQALTSRAPKDVLITAKAAVGEAKKKVTRAALAATRAGETTRAEATRVEATRVEATRAALAATRAIEPRTT